MEDAQGLADAWERHYSHLDEPLFWALEPPEGPPLAVEGSQRRDELMQRYADALKRVCQSLGRARIEDWSWPSISSLGGVETLSEAARRWLAHHHVHREDIHEILGLSPDRHEETVRLVVEFTLHALRTVGGMSVPGPMAMKVITVAPGSGAWTLVFEDPLERNDALETWRKLLGWEAERPPAQRIERGLKPGTRVTVQGVDETVWRAGFRRGHSWDDLSVLGDDEAVQAWEQLIEMLEGGLEGLTEAYG